LSNQRVLLDENLPHKLRALLSDFETFTVAYMGWIGTRNGDLLDAAEKAGFDVLSTSDQGFPHQQNLGARKLAILLLPTPNWNVVKHEKATIMAAIEACVPGSVVRVQFDPNNVVGKTRRRFPG
jgi:predicted nuclease of predicted toxin-antitoxin system